MRFVGVVLPLQDEPEHDGGEERRERIDLALNSREPERIGEAIDERADESSQKCQRGRLSELSHQMGDSPEEEHHRCCRQQRVHEVDHISHMRLVGGELRHYVGSEHEERCARRMAYLQFVTTQNELGAIPERGGGLHRRNIGESGDGEYHPPHCRIDAALINREMFHAAKVLPLPVCGRKKCLTIV